MPERVAPSLGPEPRAGGGLGPYLRAVRSHPLVFALVVAATLAGALAWTVLRGDQYEATARLLVAPVSQDDDAFLGLQVIRDSGDPTRTVQTAASLVESPTAVDAAAAELGGWGREELLDAIDVEPEGQSSILAITATADGAGRAAAVANTFAEAVIAERNEALAAQIEQRVAELQAQPESPTDRIERLQSVAAGGDPTLAIAEPASPALEPSGPNLLLVLPLALLAGLTLGVGASVVLEQVDPRVRDEDELQAIYPLPVLVRVPEQGRRARRRGPQAPWAMPPVFREAFRTVLAQIEGGGRGIRTLMVTSASSGDGKTSTALNLAVAAASAGTPAVLADLDVRSPDIGRVFGVDGPPPLEQLLDPDAPGQRASELLIPAPRISMLRLLVAGAAASDPALIDSLNRRLPELLLSASEGSDLVVVDAPPLGEVGDALRIAQTVDAVILVARPGQTNRAHLEVARDLLERAGRTPIGYIIIGSRAATTHYYGHYGHYGHYGRQQPVRGRAR